MQVANYTVEEIGSEEVNSLFGTEFIACQYASPGAMGYHGGVFLVSEDGRIFYTCYLEPSPYTGFSKFMSMDELKSLFPPLGKWLNDMNIIPDGWHHEYLGMGNMLLVAEKYWERFKSRSDKLLSEHPDTILYNQWLPAILLCLEK